MKRRTASANLKATISERKMISRRTSFGGNGMHGLASPSPSPSPSPSNSAMDCSFTDGQSFDFGTGATTPVAVDRRHTICNILSTDSTTSDLASPLTARRLNLSPPRRTASNLGPKLAIVKEEVTNTKSSNHSTSLAAPFSPTSPTKATGRHQRTLTASRPILGMSDVMNSPLRSPNSIAGHKRAASELAHANGNSGLLTSPSKQARVQAAIPPPFAAMMSGKENQ